VEALEIERIVPKGANGFFWKVDDEWGLKVYYSFGWHGCAKPRFVKLERNNLKILSDVHCAPEVGDIIKVKLDLDYEGKRIQAKPLAVYTKIVHYPEKAWELYAKGYPYNFRCINEDWHSAKSFLKFQKQVKNIIKGCKLKFDGSLKLGDIMPCTKKKAWYLVDGS